MKYSSTLRVLCICFFILITTLSCNNSDSENSDVSNIENADLSASSDAGDVSNIENADLSASSDAGNVKDVVSASIIVDQVWIRNANGRGFEEQLLLEPKLVRLVPASDDNAEMLVDLLLPAGEYDQVRLVLSSGTVILADNLYVSDGYLFSTDLGNLKFPSGYQSGIKEKIEPSIEVVTRLSQELVLNFELADSFVFNGPATHAPGVKSVLFKPVIRTINNSTHGRITLSVSGSDGAKCSPDSVAGAVVTAIDTSGVNQDVSTTTDPLGEAVIKLFPGIYDILIEADGFEPLTVENNQVYVANATELGDVRLEANENPTVFNQDRAILLIWMANIAYSDGRSGGGAALEGLSKGDPLPTYSGDYVNNSLQSNQSEYTDCWQLFEYISKERFGEGKTQLFIANNEEAHDRDDIVVSFTGTSDEFDPFSDANINKVSWHGIDKAVHKGFRDAYELVKVDLRSALTEAIQANVADKSNSRVYFTGHSLGGALATLAAYDLMDYLIDEGYKKNNIIMYSFAAPRSITERLEPLYNSKVTNSSAVAAKDDVVPHNPGANLDSPATDEYTHIKQLRVLSSNIIDSTKTDAGRYVKLGKTRVENGEGLPFRGCTIRGPKPNVPSGYGTKGHDQLQYIKRIENITNQIAEVDIDIVDINGSFPGGKRIRLIWRRGVRGPCDWVALYATRKGAAFNKKAGDYIKFRDAWEWVVRADGYPLGTSTHITDKNPGGDDDDDFWIGYVDGFDRIIAFKKL